MEDQDQPISEEISLDERDQRLADTAERMRGHNLKQRGTYVECTSCPFPHGWAIGPNKQLVGVTKDGLPILKPIDIHES